MATSTETIQAALELASLGFQVFPLGGKAKPPKGWPELATSDEEEVLKLFERYPLLTNVAIKCGKVSMLIDINQNGPGGEATLRKIFGGEIPITARYDARRGPHWWFLWRLGFPAKARYYLADKTLEIIPGNSNAYTLVPPSTADGVQRLWLPGLSPRECGLAEIPDSVMAALAGLVEPNTSVFQAAVAAVVPGTNHKGPGAPTSSAAIEQIILDGAREPARHESAKSVIGSFVSGCLTQQEFDDSWEAVKNWNQRNQNVEGKLEPLPESELRSIFDWVAERERNKKPVNEWRIEKVKSEPSQFKLYTPYYEGPLFLTAKQLLRWEPIRIEAVSQKQVWLLGSLRKRWEGDKKSEAFGGVLLRESAVEEAPDEAVLSRAIAERVRDLLVLETQAGTRRLKEGEEPSIGRLPIRDETADGGGVYFAFTWLLERLNSRTSEPVKRLELSAVVKGMGAVDRSIGTGATKRTVKFLPETALHGGGARTAETI